MTHLSLLEWCEGSPPVMSGGPGVLSADFAGSPTWHILPRGSRPPWGTVTPSVGSLFISDLLESLPPNEPWWVVVWWDLRTNHLGPMAEIHLSVVASAWRVAGWSGQDGFRQRFRVPDWVDLDALPLAVVMEVMES